MKRFLILLSLFVCLAQVYAQIPTPVVVLGATTDAFIEALQIDQAVYYGQQLADNITQLGHLAVQAENMANTFKMAFNNLSQIGNVKSWDDFMEWYNRQLYMERKTVETFEGMNVSIGKKNYSLWDI